MVRNFIYKIFITYCQVLDLILYFEDNFIGRTMTRNRRKTPRYDITMWNCFERINEDLPRTNNAIEGWHNAFHVSVTKLLIFVLKCLIFRMLSAIILVFLNLSKTLYEKKKIQQLFGIKFLLAHTHKPNAQNMKKLIFEYETWSKNFILFQETTILK